MTKRLSPDDWIVAGFSTLATQGPDTLKAERLARHLGTSKGSFYWHFADVAAFHAAMMQHWGAKAVHDIIDTLSAVPDPRDRLRHLAQMAGEAAPERYGGFAAEPAIRAWSLQNPVVAAAVKRVDAGRITYLENLLCDCGLSRDLGLTIYGAYVGLDQLASQGRAGTTAALVDLVDQLLA